MNNNNRQRSKGSAILTLAIIVAALFYSFSSDFNRDDLPLMLLSVGIVIFIFGMTALFSSLRGKTDEKKQTAVPLNRPFPQPTAVKTRRPSPVFQHKDEAEEAVRCAHSTGKEKYLEQIEGFYKNGLIEREEYKILRAKYERLDLPEDYH